MEEIEMEEEPPPFWLQSTTALYDANRHRRRNGRHASNLFLNTGVLVFFLLAAAIVFLVIVIPSVLSLARQVFNPSAVKSSWNSLNIILVLFAIVCGFLGRRDEDSTPGSTPRRREIEIEERGYQSYGNDNGGGLRRRLTRNSSSYPDLRQESMWMTRERENQWRFYDDTSLYNQQFNQRFESQISYRTRSQPLPMVDEVEDGDDRRGGDAKTIEVDTCANRSSEVSQPSPSPLPPLPPPAKSEAVDNGSKEVVEEDESDTKSVEIDAPVSDQPKVLPPSNPPEEPSPPPSPMAAILPPPSPTTYLWPPPSPTTYLWPPPSPPPPPPPPPRRRPHSSMTSEQQIKEIYETIGRPSKRDGFAKRESRSKVQLPPPSPPPPPPPPPPPKKFASRYSDEKKEKSDKKSVGVNVTKDFLVSFYHQTKRKKKHQKRRSYENLDEIIEPPKTSIHRSKSTPEFPPLSPTRDPPPPPSPPPPPPPSVFHNLFSSKKGKKKKVHSVSTPAPPPPPPPSRMPATLVVRPTKVKKKAPMAPAKTVSFSSIDGTTGNGSGSPLTPMPPPPPPSPFMKKSPWKFVMQGDYVKLESFNNSSRSGYSASEDDEGSPSHTETPSAVSCPSPDVNMKADDFIARFRAKLKLEKMDSIKQKQESTEPSPLGPYSGFS